MSTFVGKLAVLLTANTGQFKKGMREGGKELTGFRAKIAATTKSLKGLGVGLGAVSIAGAGYFVKSQMNQMDALGKTADKLGINVQRLQELQHAGKLTGVEVRTMNMALQRMTRRLSEAAGGTGEARDALKELGVNAKLLNQLGPYEAFLTLADALGKVTNQSDRVRLSFKLFDSEGVALVNTLAAGREGLEKFGKQLKNTITREEIARIEELNDAWEKWKTNTGNIAKKTIIHGTGGPKGGWWDQLIEGGRTVGSAVYEQLSFGMVGRHRREGERVEPRMPKGWKGKPSPKSTRVDEALFGWRGDRMKGPFDRLSGDPFDLTELMKRVPKFGDWRAYDSGAFRRSGPAATPQPLGGFAGTLSQAPIVGTQFTRQLMRSFELQKQVDIQKRQLAVLERIENKLEVPEPLDIGAGAN